MSPFQASSLFDLSQTSHAVLFEGINEAWQVLPRIKNYLEQDLTPAVEVAVPPQAYVGPQVRIEEGTLIDPGAIILGPAWIGKNCKLRSGCYIRENVIAGDGSVLGNSSEFKNCLLFNSVETPHFNYVGDSVIGYKGHLGAGVILSNVRLDRNQVEVLFKGNRLATGLRKFGALIGDHAEIGCNSVLSPGAVIGRQSLIYPGTHWRGVLAERMVVKLAQQQTILGRRDL